MDSTSTRRIHVLQGNPTVRDRMVRALRRAGFRVVDPQDAGEPGESAPADLLVVDIDSGLDTAQSWRQTYADQNTPVLTCGLRASRKRLTRSPAESSSASEACWLARPFSADGLVAECQALVGLAGADETAPDTQPLTAEDARRLEAELDLDEGLLGPNKPAAAGRDSSVVELGDDDLEPLGDGPVAGGKLVGAVACESVDVDALDGDPIPAADADPLGSAVLNRTMPDAPAVMVPESVDEAGPEPHSFGRPQSSGDPNSLAESNSLAEPRSYGDAHESSDPHPFPEPPVDEAPSSQGSVVELPPGIERHVDNATKLLAGAWGRIGLFARQRDRANHVRHILNAVFSDGATAGAAEVERIPVAAGFSGNLQALRVADLVETIADRGLRGRLEVSVGDQDFVLFLNGDVLDSIDDLAGQDDAELLATLRRQGHLSAQLYDQLADTVADDVAAPLAMRLREQDLVSAADLLDARQRRAQRLFAKLRSRRHGRFAFIQVEAASGHAWPVDGVQLKVDALLEETSQPSSNDLGDATDPIRPAMSAPDVPAGLYDDDSAPETLEMHGEDDLDGS